MLSSVGIWKVILMSILFSTIILVPLVISIRFTVDRAVPTGMLSVWSIVLACRLSGASWKRRLDMSRRRYCCCCGEGSLLTVDSYCVVGQCYNSFLS